jgi:hypothetical protein
MKLFSRNKFKHLEKKKKRKKRKKEQKRERNDYLNKEK